jgi:hypothetical protein
MRIYVAVAAVRACSPLAYADEGRPVMAADLSGWGGATASTKGVAL